MKKLNLKKIKFKELFVQHAEKAVLVCAGIALLGFVVSALGIEKLPDDMEPPKLQERSAQAQQHVEKGECPPGLFPKSNYSARAKREYVVAENYATPIVFNEPPLGSKSKRDEPTLLSVVKLRTTSGFAPFTLIPPDAGEVRPRVPGRGMAEAEDHPIREFVRDRPVGGAKVGAHSKLVVKYWAIVTALVPVRSQYAEFKKTFESAISYQPDVDIPNYRVYQIERAEVVGGDLSKLQWEVMNNRKFDSFVEQWEGEGTDPVMPQYMFSVFVDPLGPRVGAEWGPEVAHLPEVGLEQILRKGPGGMGPGRMGPGMRDEGFPGDEDADRPGAKRQVAGEKVEAEDEDWGEGGKRKKVIEDVPETPEEKRRRTEVIGIVGETEKAVKGIDVALFRFCDYSVLPGKQYVYRVRLGLLNPNYQLPPKYLKKPELAIPKRLASQWSEPSPVVTIPYGDQLLAGPASVLTKEPTAKIHIVQVNEAVGAQIPLEHDVSRGTLANFLQQTVEYSLPGTSKLLTTTADFITEALVVDIRGGKPIIKPKPKERVLTEPGEIVVFDRFGRLDAMHEFDDDETWQNFAVPPEQPAAKQQVPGMGPGGMEGGLLDEPKKPPRSKPPRSGRSSSTRPEGKSTVRNVSSSAK